MGWHQKLNGYFILKFPSKLILVAWFSIRTRYDYISLIYEWTYRKLSWIYQLLRHLIRRKFNDHLSTFFDYILINIYKFKHKMQPLLKILHRFSLLLPWILIASSRRQLTVPIYPPMTNTIYKTIASRQGFTFNGARDAPQLMRASLRRPKLSINNVGQN